MSSVFQLQYANTVFYSGAKFRRYTGHSAHVTNVRFSTDGLHVLTTGGADHAVFQWRLIPEGHTDDDYNSEVGSLAEGGIQVDSNDEASDSDLSDVDPLDSDIEGVSIYKCLISQIEEF